MEIWAPLQAPDDVAVEEEDGDDHFEEPRLDTDNVSAVPQVCVNDLFWMAIKTFQTLRCYFSKGLIIQGVPPKTTMKS
jgi:hypothetical protein